MWYFVVAVAILLWLYLLHVFTRADLHFWKFILGSMGLFVLLIFLVQPHLTQPLARSVSALAGIVGSITGIFTSYYKYGIIFITTAVGSITLKIDFECSGVIEIMAYLSLLCFFRVYKPYEKIILSIAGTAYIMICNALRIILICVVLHFIGPEYYYIMHSLVGRIFFYVMSILLYFYVFTRPQVIQTKVGSFKYGAA